MISPRAGVTSAPDCGPGLGGCTIAMRRPVERLWQLPDLGRGHGAPERYGVAALRQS